MEGRPLARVRWHVLLFLGVAGVSGAITLLFHVMSAVMEIGGACSSGGPYVSRAECPGGVAPSAMLAMFGGMVSVGLTIAASSRLGLPPIILLGWPALFGLLGANFLRYGIDPPSGSGPEIGTLVTGVVFELMAIGPLWIGVGMLRDRRRGGHDRVISPNAVMMPTIRRLRPARSWPAQPTWPASPVRPVDPADDPVDVPVDDGDDPSLVDSLQLLAELRRRGDLTDEEFTAAKRALLSGEG